MSTVISRIVFISLFFFTETYCQTVILNDEIDSYKIGKYLEFLEDPAHNFTLDSLRNKKFEKSNVHEINKGFTNSDYWVKFTLSHEASKYQIPFILEIDFPQSCSVEMFSNDQGEKFSNTSMDFKSNFFLESPNTAFRLSIKPGQVVTYIIKIETKRGQQYFPINIFKQDAFNKKNNKLSLLFGIYYGVLIFIILFHLGFFLITKDFKYFYVVVYLTFWFIYEAFRGYGIFNQIFPIDDSIVVLIYGLCFHTSLLVFLLFYNSILNFYESPFFSVLTKFLIGYMVLGFVFFLLPLKNIIPLNLLFSITGVPFGISVMIMSLWAWKKGKSFANYYSAASISIIFFTILMMAQRSGIIQTDNPIIKYGSNVGSFGEFLFLAFGIIQSHYQTKLEKERALFKLELEEEQKLSELKLAKLEGRFQERERVANQLHDNLGNLLVGIDFQISKLGRRIGNLENSNFTELQTSVRKASNELRYLSHNLLPLKFKEKGLELSLRELGRDFEDVFGIDFGLYIDPLAKSLNNDFAFEIYCICLELINNVSKHSSAKNISLTILSRNEAIVLTVTDDGIGFDRTIIPSGRGLESIRNRIETNSGKLKIESKLNYGTKITITFLREVYS